MVTFSKIKVFFFLLIILLLIASLVLWMSVGDKGLLIIENDLPNNITGLPLQNQTCYKTPCKLAVSPGDYTVIFEKEGHYSLTKNIRVYLFEETEIQLSFLPKPFLQKIGSQKHFSLPINKVGEIYKDNQDIVFLPFQIHKKNINLNSINDIQELSFSKTGEKAFIITEQKVFFTFRKDKKEIQLSQKNDSLVWHENKVYFWYKIEGTNIWELNELDTENLKRSRIGIFYNLPSPRIIISNNHILIISSRHTYLLDLSKHSKKEILDKFLIEHAKWNKSGSQFLFQTKEKEIYLFDIKKEEITNILSIEKLDHIDFLGEKIVYALENSSEISVYDIKTKQEDLIVSVPVKSEEIEKLEVYQNRIYLLIDKDIYLIEGEY